MLSGMRGLVSKTDPVRAQRKSSTERARQQPNIACRSLAQFSISCGSAA